MEHNSNNQERLMAETIKEAWEAIAKENAESIDSDEEQTSNED